MTTFVYLKNNDHRKKISSWQVPHLTWQKQQNKCGSSWQNVLEIYCQVSYCQISSHFLKHTQLDQSSIEALKMFACESEKRAKWGRWERKRRDRTGFVWLNSGCMLTRWITIEWGMPVFVETFAVMSSVLSLAPPGQDSQEGPGGLRQWSCFCNVAWLVTWLLF